MSVYDRMGCFNVKLHNGVCLVQNEYITFEQCATVPFVVYFHQAGFNLPDITCCRGDASKATDRSVSSGAVKCAGACVRVRVFLCSCHGYV